MKSVRIILMMLLLLLPSTSMARSIELTVEQSTILQNLENDGMIRMDCHYVYVNRMLWSMLTFQQKGDFAALLAVACKKYQKFKIDVYYVTIYDLYSGKKLATWNSGLGMKVY